MQTTWNAQGQQANGQSVSQNGFGNLSQQKMAALSQNNEVYFISWSFSLNLLAKTWDAVPKETWAVNLTHAQISSENAFKQHGTPDVNNSLGKVS